MDAHEQHRPTEGGPPAGRHGHVRGGPGDPPHATPAAHPDHDRHAGHSIDAFRRRFWICLILTLPALLWGHMLAPLVGHLVPAFSGSSWIAPICGTAVFLIGGPVFLRGAWRELRDRQPGMMTLISLAIAVAFLFSAAVTLGFPGMPLWEELATLVTIMLLGHWIEMKSIQRAQGALRELAKLLPDTAERLMDGGSEMVPVAQLREGDVVLVRPGSSVPADGRVREGRSAVNEAMVTGESLPVAKAPGDEVIAGTVNGGGSLRVVVTGTGERTALAGIMRLVEQAQNSRSGAQALADRAARLLTFVAVGAGLLTLAAWLLLGSQASYAIERMVTVLVIACPHALGLAVPLVIAISTTLGAQAGLLVRDRRGLEEARRLDTVVFDKTGTLTLGEHRVVGIVVSPGAGETRADDAARSADSSGAADAAGAGGAADSAHTAGSADAAPSAYAAETDDAAPSAETAAAAGAADVTEAGGEDGAAEAAGSAGAGAPHADAQNEALRVAAAAEADSEHPIARALVSTARERDLALPPATEFEALPGQGVRATVDGRQVHVGGPNLLQHLGITLPGAIPQGAVYLVEGERVRAAFTLADAIRPESREAVERLHAQGIEVAMLTGDAQSVADAVARTLGIDSVLAQIPPERKAERIATLQASGRRVAMVGDGVNDAPALVTADVGVAIGAGTDVAVEAGDVVLVRSDPRDVARIIDLSRATYRKMLQNLGWAAGYNVVAIPLAAGVMQPWGLVLSPSVGAVLMSVSTVVVAINAQLLRRSALSGPPRAAPSRPHPETPPVDHSAHTG